MIHNTVTENDISTMVHLDELLIPAGETITFAPGGLHIMFMGLNGDPFKVGEVVPATLVFKNAGEIRVVFNVERMEDAHSH